MIFDLMLISVISLLLPVLGYLFRERYVNMVGKVLAMTVGMMAGTLYGLVFGLYAHDLSFATIFGVLCGMFFGFCMGMIQELSAALEGLVAGVMGGMMGAMLGCMLVKGTLMMLTFLSGVYLAVSIVMFVLMRGANRANEQAPATRWRPWIDWVVAVLTIGCMFLLIGAYRGGL